MPFYKFDPTDKFINTVVTYPSVEFVIYDQAVHYNKEIAVSGARAPSVRHVPAGNISLYEYNIDRETGSYGEFLASNGVVNTGLVQPWSVKDGTRISFKTVSITGYNGLQPGDVVSGSYPMSATISKEYYPTSFARKNAAVIFDAPTWGASVIGFADSGSQNNNPSSITGAYHVDSNDNGIRSVANVSHLFALRNTMERYRHVSPHYTVSSSVVGGGRDLTASSGDVDPDGNVIARPSPDPAPPINVGLVSVPSIFYGSGIKKGSVKLQFYITGALHGTLEDSDRNGELIQTGPTGSPYSGSVAGVVLYNEGIMVLTGGWDLSDGAHSEKYWTTTAGVDTAAAPSWALFGQSLSGTITAPSSSFTMYFSGTTKTQTLTMFANANKGELNHSNNPTNIRYGNMRSGSVGYFGYTQSDKQIIKNIVSSSYNDPTGSFKKTTYISKMGIYDYNKNLIAIAKVATPVKKTEERDFTFKLKLDV